MAKLLYSASMSLDGFIAGPGGDMSWLSEYMAPNPPIDGLVGDIGALLIGNRTFRGDDPNKGTENEGAYGERGRARRSSSPTMSRTSRCRA
ncbi:dihydrofolate reductase family protein [Prauserella oleivorans]